MTMCLFFWEYKLYNQLDYTLDIRAVKRQTHESVYLFGVLRRFQHCTGHITTGSWKGRGNQYIEFARVLYCKLPTNGKQLPAFPHKALMGIKPRPQRWEARVLPLCYRGPRLMRVKQGYKYVSISPFTIKSHFQPTSTKLAYVFLWGTEIMMMMMVIIIVGFI